MKMRTVGPCANFDCSAETGRIRDASGADPVGPLPLPPDELVAADPHAANDRDATTRTTPRLTARPVRICALIAAALDDHAATGQGRSPLPLARGPTRRGDGWRRTRSRSRRLRPPPGVAARRSKWPAAPARGVSILPIRIVFGRPALSGATGPWSPWLRPLRALRCTAALHPVRPNPSAVSQRLVVRECELISEPEHH